MTPEAQEHIEKARHCLSNANINLSAGLGDDAGRNAYLAAYHASQAYILTQKGEIARTHRGVHHLLFELTTNDPRFDSDMRRFPSKAYDLKAIADYEIGPGAIMPLDYIAQAVETATRLVDCIEAVLIKDGQKS